eukprot:gene2029-2351_t
MRSTALVLLLAFGSTFYAAAQEELLKVPSGFSIAVWRKDLSGARMLASVKVKGDTIVYVGSVSSNVYYVVDRGSDGTPDFSGSLLSDINTPNGVAVRGNDLYVSGFQGGKGMVWKIRNAHTYALQNKAYDGTRTVVTDQLPGDGWHGRRVLRFDPNGVLVLGIGAPCNVCQLDTISNGVQYGTLYALNVTTGQLVQLAKGVRNSVGFDFHPGTKQLYFTDNGRDELGDNSPDCELNRLPFTYNSYRSLVSQPRSGTKFQLAVKVGGKVVDFGFPFCQTQGLGNPYRRNVGAGVPLVDPDLNPRSSAVNCSGTGAYYQPVQAVGPHTAPLGMRFYRYNPNAPQSFPASFKRVIFIAEHGSWNRARKIGYRVMMLRLGRSSSTAPLTAQVYKQFAWGWLRNENTPSDDDWGRPVDVEQLPDGSMLVSDDATGWLYRITYTASTAATATAGDNSSSTAGN